MDYGITGPHDYKTLSKAARRDYKAILLPAFLVSSGSRAAKQLRYKRWVGNTPGAMLFIVACQSFDRSYKDLDVQRLFHEGIDTQLDGFLVLIRTRGDNYDRQRGRRVVKHAKRCPSVPVRHTHVEQHQVGRMLKSQPDCLHAVAGLIHDVALGLEHSGKAPPNGRVVIGNQYPLRAINRALAINRLRACGCAGTVDCAFVFINDRPASRQAMLPGR